MALMTIIHHQINHLIMIATDIPTLDITTNMEALTSLLMIINVTKSIAMMIADTIIIANIINAITTHANAAININQQNLYASQLIDTKSIILQHFTQHKKIHE